MLYYLDFAYMFRCAARHGKSCDLLLHLATGQNKHQIQPEIGLKLTPPHIWLGSVIYSCQMHFIVN